MEDIIKELKDAISIEDCPLGCNNGYIFNHVLKKKELCPHCKGTRESIVRNKTNSDIGAYVYSMLNLPTSVSELTFDLDNILPEFARVGLVKEDLDTALSHVKELNDLSLLGTLPEYSSLLTLGSKVNVLGLVAPILINYFRSGVVTAPLVSVSDIAVALKEQESRYGTTKSSPIKYKDLVNADFCFVVIDAGTPSEGILIVKGLMSERARHDKSTTILSLSWDFRSMSFELDSNGLKCKHLAYCYKVPFKSSLVESDTDEGTSSGLSEPSAPVKRVLGTKTVSMSTLKNLR